MIKIGTKQVNKIVINNKEVLKVIQGDGTSTGILKYQKSGNWVPGLTLSESAVALSTGFSTQGISGNTLVFINFPCYASTSVSACRVYTSQTYYTLTSAITGSNYVKWLILDTSIHRLYIVKDVGATDPEYQITYYDETQYPIEYITITQTSNGVNRFPTRMYTYTIDNIANFKHNISFIKSVDCTSYNTSASTTVSPFNPNASDYIELTDHSVLMNLGDYAANTYYNASLEENGQIISGTKSVIGTSAMFIDTTTGTPRIKINSWLNSNGQSYSSVKDNSLGDNISNLTTATYTLQIARGSVSTAYRNTYSSGIILRIE